jgi:hypothetical protein
MSVSTLHPFSLTFPFRSVTNNPIRTNCAQIRTVWRRCGHFPKRCLHHRNISSYAMVRAKGNRQVTSNWFCLVACFFSSCLRPAHLHRIFNINIIYSPINEKYGVVTCLPVKTCSVPLFFIPRYFHLSPGQNTCQKLQIETPNIPSKSTIRAF